MLFFKKKQKKLDPKVRFQNRQFNQKLQQARTFKRAPKPIIESKLERFLHQIGLGSRLLQALLVLLVIGIVYVIYIPNFLTLQKIIIEGTSDSDRSLIEASVRNALGSAPLYDPQRNLLFTSKSRIADAVLAVNGVDTLQSISKEYANGTLRIKVLSKYEKYLVRTSDHVFDVYNDGTFKGEAGMARDEWDDVENAYMLKVNIDAQVEAQQAMAFFTKSTVTYLTELQENANGIIGSSVLYVNISNREINLKDEVTSEESEVVNEQNTVSDEPEPIEIDGLDSASQKDLLRADQDANAVIDKISVPISPGQLEIIFQKGENPNKTFRVIVNTKESAHDAVQRLNLLLSQTSADRYANLSYIDLRVKSRAYICLLNTVCD